MTLKVLAAIPRSPAISALLPAMGALAIGGALAMTGLTLRLAHCLGKPAPVAAAPS